MVSGGEPRRALTVRRILQLATGGVAVGVLGLGLLTYAVFLPRIAALRSDTETLIARIHAFAEHAARLDTAVVVALRQLERGDIEGADLTVHAARAETSTSLAAAARDALIHAPLEMQTSLATVLDHESQIRDHLSEAGALIRLGEIPRALEALTRADSLSAALSASLAAAQEAGLMDVARRSGALERLARDVSRTLVWVALAAVLGVLAIARVLHLRVSVPLRRLDAGMRAVSAGDLSGSVHAERADELGRLATLFNRMILELRQRERERESERREMTRSILDATLDAVITITPAGEITGWNPGARRIFGWPADQVMGRVLEDLVFTEPERVHPHLTAPRVGGPECGAAESRRVEVPARRADGGLLTAEMSAVPIVEGGVIVARAVFIRDITETLALQDQLRRSQRLDAVGRLAGGIAHDFNNLMSVILAQTQLALESVPEPDVREGLQEVERAAHRAAELTSQLLAFARKRMVAPRVVPVNQLVTETLEMAKPAIESSVRVSLDLDPDAGNVSVDPGHLSQVLLNLLLNARDAVDPRGGTVAIASRALEFGEEERHGEPVDVPPGRYVLLTVTDNGAGLSEQVRERLFEPFFSTKPHGTGLGLATCHGIVRQAGGTIAARNVADGGAEFAVYLPRVS